MKFSFNSVFFLFLVFSFQLTSCAQPQKKSPIKEVAKQEEPKTIKTGADRTAAYLPLIKNKNIAN